MIVDKTFMETMIMFLYHTDEFEACEKVFEVYRKHFCEEEVSNRLTVVRNDEDVH